MWSATVALYKCRIKADLRDRAEKSGRGRNGNREAQCCQIVRVFRLKFLIESLEIGHMKIWFNINDT